MKEKERVNQCRYCNKVLRGLMPCECMIGRNSQKLWSNPRKVDRVRISESLVKLHSDNKGLKTK